MDTSFDDFDIGPQCEELAVQSLHWKGYERMRKEVKVGNVELRGSPKGIAILTQLRDKKKVTEDTDFYCQDCGAIAHGKKCGKCKSTNIEVGEPPQVSK